METQPVVFMEAVTIGVTEAVIILGIVTLFFGGKKIPQVAEALGKAIRNFRNASDQAQSEEDSEAGDDDAQPRA